jgi:predicted DNA-binding transcriptional regulator YafY
VSGFVYHGAMRASRLVALLLLLQSRGGMTAAELAQELEVSVRTVHRDVEALGAAGVPIYAERGPHGGIRLVDGYRTRLTGMTSDEAEALFLSGMPGPAAELGLGTVVAGARLKVLAALPPELRGRASRLLERFHLDAAGWFRSGEAVPHLSKIAECVWDGRRVEIDYDRGDTLVTRTLDPLGLVLKAGTWYLVASHDDQLRTYRVSRVMGAAGLQDKASRPDGFDLAAYWAESIATYEREAPRIEVTVRVRHDAYRRLEEMFSAAVLASARELADPEPDTWRRVTLTLDWPREAVGKLLAMGTSLELLEPLTLRAELGALAVAVAARYAGDAAVPAREEALAGSRD